MRPLRTAATTAALRRTTQRLVFGGGRSSLIGGSRSADRSSALLTRPSQDLGGPERPVAGNDLLPARLAAVFRVALQRGPVGGRDCALCRQRAGCRTTCNPVAPDKSLDCRLVLFVTHR